MSFKNSLIQCVIQELPHTMCHSRTPSYNVSFKNSPIQCVSQELPHTMCHSRTPPYNVSFKNSLIQCVIQELPHTMCHSRTPPYNVSFKNSPIQCVSQELPRTIVDRNVSFRNSVSALESNCCVKVVTRYIQTFICIHLKSIFKRYLGKICL